MTFRAIGNGRERQQKMNRNKHPSYEFLQIAKVQVFAKILTGSYWMFSKITK